MLCWLFRQTEIRQLPWKAAFKAYILLFCTKCRLNSGVASKNNLWKLQREVVLAKDLWRYGQNTRICQLQDRGDSKPLYIALLKPNIFLISCVKILSYAYKTWGVDTIWYFSYLCRKFGKLRVIAFFWFYSKQPKSEIHLKMPLFEQLFFLTPYELVMNFLRL